MDKLGFTFYPKDWATSDTFFELDANQRYIFLECMFLMYQNGGYIKTQKTQIENRLRIEIKPNDWEKITQRFTQDENGFTLVSVNKRLRKTLANRKNGAKGGRPKKPKKPNSETQKNPPLEREREREIELNILQIDNWILELRTQEQFLDSLYLTYKLKDKSIFKIAQKFKSHLMAYPKQHDNFMEFRNHFRTWIGFEIKKGNLGEYLKNQIGQI